MAHSPCNGAQVWDNTSTWFTSKTVLYRTSIETPEAAPVPVSASAPPTDASGATTDKTAPAPAAEAIGGAGGM